MTSDLIVLAASTITISILGLVVYLRNERSRVGQAFLGITISAVIWSAANYFADHATNLIFNDIAARIAFIAGIWIVLALLIFSYVFPRERLHRRQFFILMLVSGCLSAFAGSELVVASVIKSTTSIGIEIRPGQLYDVYLLIIIGYVGLVLVNFLKSYRESNRLRRNQLKFITVGVSASALFAVTTNLIIPVLVSDWTSSRYGTLSALIFVSALAYAIVRYRFLNIRLIIARSVGYLLLLATLTTVYSVIVIGISQLLFPGRILSTGQQVTYLIVALLLAFSFRSFRRFFDKVTQALFYREAYDSQKILDKVSAALVNSSSVKSLVDEVAAAANDAIRPRYAQIAIMQDGAERSIVLGRKTNAADTELLELTAATNAPLIVIDEMDNRSQEVYRALRKADVAVVVRMQTAKEFIGLVLLGSKETGGIYTAQDINLIRIIADELSVAIQNALRFEKIERFNETLQKEIEQATAELRKTNRKLQALDEAKDEFISMASHQLRTPLTSVKGYVSMALDGDAGKLNTDQRHLLQEAYSSAQRMVYMIADLLNVSRLQTGKFVLEPSSVSLLHLIREEVDQLSAASKARGLTIALNVPDQFPMVTLDENKIRQVIMNLLDNAVFYSKSGGTITVTLKKTLHDVVLTVEDNGIGVPAHEQNHLFTKFFRATNAKSARPDGTGIGLFMAQKVIAAHHGSIIFTSEENKGSTFGFRVPLENALKNQ